MADSRYSVKNFQMPSIWTGLEWTSSGRRRGWSHDRPADSEKAHFSSLPLLRYEPSLDSASRTFKNTSTRIAHRNVPTWQTSLLQVSVVPRSCRCLCSARPLPPRAPQTSPYNQRPQRPFHVSPAPLRSALHPRPSPTQPTRAISNLRPYPVCPNIKERRVSTSQHLRQGDYPTNRARCRRGARHRTNCRGSFGSGFRAGVCRPWEG
jgi:hypothetical protein